MLTVTSYRTIGTFVWPEKSAACSVMNHIRRLRFPSIRVPRGTEFLNRACAHFQVQAVNLAPILVEGTRQGKRSSRIGHASTPTRCANDEFNGQYHLDSRSFLIAFHIFDVIEQQ